MSTPEFDAAPWQEKTAAVFAALAAKRHAARRTVELDIHCFRNSAITKTHVAMTLAVVALVAGLFINPLYSLRVWLTHPWSIFSIWAVSMACLAYVCLGTVQRTYLTVNTFLSLTGRSMPLTEDDLGRLVEWSELHPELVSILGAWMAANPDNRLNQHDFQAARQAVFKARAIRLDMEKNHEKVVLTHRRNEKIAAQLRELGVTAAANHVRLTSLAEKSGARAQEPPRAL